MLKVFYDKVMGAELDGPQRRVMKNLVRLYALSGMQEYAGDFLEVTVTSYDAAAYVIRMLCRMAT